MEINNKQTNKEKYSVLESEEKLAREIAYEKLDVSVCVITLML